MSRVPVPDDFRADGGAALPPYPTPLAEGRPWEDEGGAPGNPRIIGSLWPLVRGVSSGYLGTMAANWVPAVPREGGRP